MIACSFTEIMCIEIIRNCFPYILGLNKFSIPYMDCTHIRFVFNLVVCQIKASDNFFRIKIFGFFLTVSVNSIE